MSNWIWGWRDFAVDSDSFTGRRLGLNRLLIASSRRRRWRWLWLDLGKAEIKANQLNMPDSARNLVLFGFDKRMSNKKEKQKAESFFNTIIHLQLPRLPPGPFSVRLKTKFDPLIFTFRQFDPCVMFFLNQHCYKFCPLNYFYFGHFIYFVTL